MIRFTALKGTMSAFFALAMLITFADSASAAPTASFTYRAKAPVVARPVRFTFTGTCDVAPCRIQWRWFKTGGSSLGTTIGEGSQVAYAFPAAGTYSVVAKITNATRTHGSATATHALIVKSRPVAVFRPSTVAR